MDRRPSRRIAAAAAASGHRQRPIVHKFDPKNFPTPQWDPERDGDNSVPYDLFLAKRNTDELLEEMVVPVTRPVDPKVQIFDQRVTRKEREAAARKLLLMKEFGSTHGPDTIPKLEAVLETRQKFNDRPPAMLDPASHTYAKRRQRSSSGFVQRMLYHQNLMQRDVMTKKEKELQKSLNKLRGVPERKPIPRKSQLRSDNVHKGKSSTPDSSPKQRPARPYSPYKLRPDVISVSVKSLQSSTSPKRHVRSSTSFTESSQPRGQMSLAERQQQDIENHRRKLSFHHRRPSALRRSLVAGLEVPDQKPAVHVHDNFVKQERTLTPNQRHARTLRDGLKAHRAVGLHSNNSERGDFDAETFSATRTVDGMSQDSTDTSPTSIGIGTDKRESVRSTGISVNLPRLNSFGGGYIRVKDDGQNESYPLKRGKPCRTHRNAVSKRNTFHSQMGSQVPNHGTNRWSLQVTQSCIVLWSFFDRPQIHKSTAPQS